MCFTGRALEGVGIVRVAALGRICSRAAALGATKLNRVVRSSSRPPGFPLGRTPPFATATVAPSPKTFTGLPWR